MPEFPFKPPGKPPVPPPPAGFLADLYRAMPCLVVHLTTDGIVLNCNPETARITGYDEGELIGRNFWATLFPGKLFAQVPKFISPTGGTAGGGGGSPLLRDVPMTLRRRDGKERIVAFTRAVHAPELHLADATDTGLKTIICMGVDLTDRLTDADRAAAGLEGHAGDAPAGMGVAMSVGNGGAVEGEIVVPIAISAPSPLPGDAALGMGPAPGSGSGPSAEAVRQVHDFLEEIDARMAALQAAAAAGAMGHLQALAGTLHDGARACGLLEFSQRAEQLQQAASGAKIAPVKALMHEILAMYKPKT